MSILKCSCGEDQDLHAETYLRKLKNNYILWSWGKYLHSWHTYTTQRINPQGAKIHASTTPCEYTCWPGVIGFPTILEYIHSINTTNGLIGVYTFLHTNTLFVCWLPPMHATMASILRLLCLIPPRLLLSHSQAAIASFPGCHCLIPRLPLSHSQAVIISYKETQLQFTTKTRKASNYTSANEWALRISYWL